MINKYIVSGFFLFLLGQAMIWYQTNSQFFNSQCLEIDIYEEYGIFEDGQFLALPEPLKEREGQFEVVYTNPLSKMQLSEAALGVERTIQSLLPLAPSCFLERGEN
mgnify:CR=1 FL=1